jgi:hypothetical protein
MSFFPIRNPTIVETETNRQLLIKLKKNEYGELTTSAIQNDISLNLNHNNEYTNGHNNSLHEPLNIPVKYESKTPIQPHITNMLSNLNDDKQWNNHHISQQTTTNRYI